jgi:hypothetical protein
MDFPHRAVPCRPWLTPTVASGTNICSCAVDLDCAGQEDGNLCNGTLFCDKTALQLTKDMGGAKYPVCATDWKPIFADLAKTVFAVCDYAFSGSGVD